MKNNLYIMIGLPGSGKDTLAKSMQEHITRITSIDTVILSSDDIRNELYGWEDQTHNGEVFQEMNKRCKKTLQDGKHVIYNATNLNLRRRKALISEMKKYYNNVFAVLCLATMGTLVERNFTRPERRLPFDKLFQMFKTIDIPMKYEGYDKIFVGYSSNFDEDYSDFLGWMLRIGKDYDQHNEHHNATVLEHLELTSKKAFELSNGDENLSIAGRFHDIGKPYSREWNEEKQKYTYYNHHTISAYLYLIYWQFKHNNHYYLLNPLDDKAMEISMLIYHHMDKFIGNLEKTKELLGDDLYKKLEILMEADAYREEQINEE